jgi:hypothetical protein
LNARRPQKIGFFDIFNGDEHDDFIQPDLNYIQNVINVSNISKLEDLYSAIEYYVTIHYNSRDITTVLNDPLFYDNLTEFVLLGIYETAAICSERNDFDTSEKVGVKLGLSTGKTIRKGGAKVVDEPFSSGNIGELTELIEELSELGNSILSISGEIFELYDKGVKTGDVKPYAEKRNNLLKDIKNV